MHCSAEQEQTLLLGMSWVYEPSLWCRMGGEVRTFARKNARLLLLPPTSPGPNSDS